MTTSSPVLQTPATGPNPPGGQVVAFRDATIERANSLTSETGTISAAIQQFDRTVEGSGYVYGIMLDMVAAVPSTNSATVAFTEDAPFNSLNNVTFRDVNGELVNVPGYTLYLVNLAMRQYAVNGLENSALYTAVTGAGATGGNFSFLLRVPVATDRRRLLGLTGNQDRAVKFSLRTNIDTSATIYGTAPTALPAFTLNKYYENYAVPLPVGPMGQPQEVYPRTFGIYQFTTSTINETVPMLSSTMQHYLRRLGNTIRAVIFEFRSNALRATAETALTAGSGVNLQLRVGEDTLFNESYRYRRALMYERYGFNWPNGVLCYDFLHDFASGAGNEQGSDYLNTGNIVNALLQVSYPATWTNASSSVRITTLDLQRGAPALTQPNGAR